MREEALDLLNKARAIGEEGIGAVAEDVGGDSDIIAASASIRAWRLVQVSLPACLSGSMLPSLREAPSQTWGGGADIGWSGLRVRALNSINLTGGSCPSLPRQRTLRLAGVSQRRLRPTAICRHVLAVQSNLAVCR